MAKIPGETGAHRVYKGTQERATATDGSIVEKGTNGRTYRYVPKYDHTVIVDANGRTSQPLKGNQLPSQMESPETSMNSYIDTVLEKSGMVSPGSVPIPQPRPTDYMDDETSVESGMVGTENSPGKLKDDLVTVDSEDPADASGFSTAELLLGALGIGGGVAAARALYNRYKSGNLQSDIASMSNPNGMPNVDAQKGGRIPAPEQQRMLTGPNAAIEDGTAQQQLAPPPKQITGPETSAVDEMINEIDGEPKQLTDADAPYTPRNPESRMSAAPVSEDVVQRAAYMVDQGDIRGAFRLLNESGVNIGEDILQMFADQSNTVKGLRERAAKMAGNAARRAATQ